MASSRTLQPCLVLTGAPSSVCGGSRGGWSDGAALGGSCGGWTLPGGHGHPTRLSYESCVPQALSPSGPYSPILES